MDYLNLHRDYGVTLQTGGSDQWGNITGGVELIRRADGARVHALATPLITRADGTKYGKTEGGALWLDPEMTLAVRLLPVLAQRRGRRRSASCCEYFTFLSREEIEELEAADRREAVPAGRAEGAGRARDHAGARRRGDRADQGGLRGAVRRRRPPRARRGRRWRAALREAGSDAGQAADGTPTIVDLLVAPGCPRARARPGARSARAAPT